MQGQPRRPSHLGGAVEGEAEAHEGGGRACRVWGGAGLAKETRGHQAEAASQSISMKASAEPCASPSSSRNRKRYLQRQAGSACEYGSMQHLPTACAPTVHQTLPHPTARRTPDAAVAPAHQERQEQEGSHADVAHQGSHPRPHADGRLAAGAGRRAAGAAHQPCLTASRGGCADLQRACGAVAGGGGAGGRLAVDSSQQRALRAWQAAGPTIGYQVNHRRRPGRLGAIPRPRR